jgi:hypothetical protein
MTTERGGGEVRIRTAALVAGGFVAGAFSAYFALWRAHALVAGHPLAIRPAEFAASTPLPRRTLAPPTATPSAGAAPPSAAAPTPPPRDGRP